MTTCEGCKRHQANPRHTIRTWVADDPDTKIHGRWMHVDPSGVAYDCDDPTGGRLVCPNCDGTGWIHTDDGKDPCPAACDHGLLDWWTCAECSEGFNANDATPAQIARGEEVRCRPYDTPFWNCDKCFSVELAAMLKRVLPDLIVWEQRIYNLANVTNHSDSLATAGAFGEIKGYAGGVLDILRVLRGKTPKPPNHEQLPLGLYGRIKP